MAEQRRVRVATTDDGPGLAHLRWRWRVDEEGERSPGTPDDFARDLTGWMAAHEQSHVAFVAEVDGIVVGMTWLAIVERIPGPERWRRLSGYLQSLYVQPEYRGSGLGRDLVDALVTEARGRGLDYVSVHPSARSFPLYRRAGFLDAHRVLQLRF